MIGIHHAIRESEGLTAVEAWKESGVDQEIERDTAKSMASYTTCAQCGMMKKGAGRLKLESDIGTLSQTISSDESLKKPGYHADFVVKVKSSHKREW
jgi:hypothetical protein